ncbi:MAG: transglycosylase SLT domain-containing protein [Hyphomicrobiales bacterium]|nr:transglycosylase SLT domain-containing protein [Hyphomicrobiales bacterium]MBV9113886.1 transglycosylase SLT domain-containing protein [Hyphomicrobiales bacterium]MBV9518393.1 transglycosylase SLT domain-containing protein [Hyphomicrobiales bacterium]
MKLESAAKAIRVFCRWRSWRGFEALIPACRCLSLAAPGLAALLATVIWSLPAGEGEDARVAKADHVAIAILASLDETERFAPAVPEELRGSDDGQSVETALPLPFTRSTSGRADASSEDHAPSPAAAPSPYSDAGHAREAVPDSVLQQSGILNSALGPSDTADNSKVAPLPDTSPRLVATAQEPVPKASTATNQESAPVSGVPAIEAFPPSSSSPSAAIDELMGGSRKAAAIPASTNAHLALALPYGETDAKPNATLPQFVVPPTPSEVSRPGEALPQLQPKDLEPASVMPGDSNPVFPPLPAFIAPPDANAAKLALAAYRKGDMALGDAFAATAKTEVARVALEWAAIRLDARGTGFNRLTAFLRDHADWPAAPWLRRRGEEALFGDKQGFSLLASYFSKAQPESAPGKLALARLEREQGRIEEAQALVREVWREGDINQSLEAKVTEEFGKFITPADHKFRADLSFYKEESGRLMRAAKLAGDDETALAKAQFAVLDEAHNADALLAALPEKLKSDPSYIFARIEVLRRANKPEKLAEAVKLMLAAPRDPDVIVDGDAWWVERRLIARKLLDAGDARTAYHICAEHSAQSSEKRIEAEFHAGWIALRFLQDPSLAAPHFATAAAIAALPASVARAAYWLGRTAQALGDEAAATAAYQQAAQHVTTYYGQLARSKLGLSDLPLRQTHKLATGDDRDLAIRVAEFFYALGESDLALPIVSDAARQFTDEGQMAALGKVVETGRDARAALILGKLATQRGIPLDDFAFPVFGVPYYQPVANSADKAIVYAIARQESAFAPTATSTAGAQGLMQLMPDTARRAALHAGISLDMAKLNTDAALNARIGAAHLGELFAEEGGSYVLTFAAYNAGGKRVKEWIAAHGDPRRRDVDPVDWIELIPITETRDYVQRIIENMQVYRTRFGVGSRPIDEADLRRPGGG